MTTRDEMVRALAPAAPLCWDDRSTWISYCQSAATEQRMGHPSGPLSFTGGKAQVAAATLDATAQPPFGASVPVLLLERGRVVRFNPDFNFCRECLAPWAADMQRKGRCKPQYLRDLLSPPETP